MLSVDRGSHCIFASLALKFLKFFFEKRTKIIFDLKKYYIRNDIFFIPTAGCAVLMMNITKFGSVSNILNFNLRGARDPLRLS